MTRSRRLPDIWLPGSETAFHERVRFLIEVALLRILAYSPGLRPYENRPEATLPLHPMLAQLPRGVRSPSLALLALPSAPPSSHSRKAFVNSDSKMGCI